MGEIKAHYITSRTDPMFVNHLEAENEIFRNQIELIHKENEILRKYRDLVWFIANDCNELSYEKIQWQRNDWKKRCIELRVELELDDSEPEPIKEMNEDF